MTITTLFSGSSDFYMSQTPLTKLTQAHSAGLRTFEGTASDAFDLAASLNAEGKHTLIARVVRGTKSRSMRELFDELAAAWQFPPYFGENWNAVDECLDDMDWLPCDHYVMVITDAHLLLKDEKADALRVFVDVLEELKAGPKKAPFRTVFQTDASHRAAFHARLTTAGAKPEPL